MYDICILTTAIIRPKLHLISMNSLKDILKKDTKIYWIINIDFVNTKPKFIKSESLTDNYKTDCLQLTELNFRNIFKDYKNIEFKFINNKEGNFNKAVRNLLDVYIKIKNNIKYGVLYLEDDWIVTNKQAIINDYFGSFSTNENCLGISFIKNSRIGFKPTLWNQKYFEEIFLNTFFKNTETKIDPEQLVRSNNKYGYKKEDLDKFSKFLEKSKYIHFRDIGINWRINNSLIKWNWNNDITSYK